jgi:integrase
VCKHLERNPDHYKPSFFWVSVIYLLYFTGMRRRQLVTLRMRDIDFESAQIQLSYEGSKTHRSWKIPVHPEALVRLEDMVWRSEAAIGRRLQDDDFIFVASRFYNRYAVNRNGSMKAESITGFFKRLSRDIGISVGAHRFRHTLATKMCNPEGEDAPDIFAVQAFLGHTSIQTTRGYAQTKSNRLVAVLDKMRVPFKSGYA